MGPTGRQRVGNQLLPLPLRLGLASRRGFSVEPNRNRFSNLLSLEQEAEREPSDSLYEIVNSNSSQSEEADSLSMMSMHFPSIGNAFVNGEGSSIGNMTNGHTPIPYDNSMHQTLPDDVLATSHRGALNTALQSKEEMREFLITHPICRVFYQSSSPLGYYKKYRHLYLDRVCSIRPADS